MFKIITKSFLRQGMTILPASLNNLGLGFAFGWVAPAIAYFNSKEAAFVISDTQISWIASVYFATEVGSAIFHGAFSKKFGRKPMLIFTAFLICIAWGIQVMAKSAWEVILSRALHGIAAGTQDVTWAMYVGEVTSPVERGIFGPLLIILFILGILVPPIINLYMSYVYMSIVPFVISIVNAVLMCLIVESPHYSVTKGEYDKACRNLTWLRGHSDHRCVEAEFLEVKHHLEKEMSHNIGLFELLKSPSKHKVAIVGILIFTIAQPTGNIAILSYQTILLDLFHGFSSGKNLSLIYVILELVFIPVSPYVMEKVGRRVALLIGFCTSAVIMAAVAVLFYIEETNEHTSPAIPYIVCGLFNLYGVVYAMCILSTVYVLKSELFSQEEKTIANCSCTVMNAFANFVVVKLFMWIWLTCGLYVNFVLYSSICIVGVMYVYWLVPETKGKSLVQIQKGIRAKSKKSVWRETQAE